MSETDTSLESVNSTEDDGLEPIYQDLKSEGLNTVDGIVHILRNAKVIDETNHSEKIVRQMFDDCEADRDNVEYEPFRQVVTRLATKLELLKIAWRLKKAERQLRKAERDMNKALRHTSRGMGKSIEENKELKYSYSKTTQRVRRR